MRMGLYFHCLKLYIFMKSDSVKQFISKSLFNFNHNQRYPFIENSLGVAHIFTIWVYRSIQAHA